MLLVHGWEGRGAQLGAFVRPLVSAGFRVIAWDGPGHGDSPGRRATMVSLSGAVNDAGWTYGPVHGVIAHSMGCGAVTAALARGLEAERLVFVAPPGPLPAVFAGFADFIGLPEAGATTMRRRLEKRIGADVADWDLHELAPGRGEPLLVVHSRDDTDTPFAHGHDLVQLWPGAQLHPTDGLGHRRILRDERAVRAAVRHLLR